MDCSSRYPSARRPSRHHLPSRLTQPDPWDRPSKWKQHCIHEQHHNDKHDDRKEWSYNINHYNHHVLINPNKKIMLWTIIIVLLVLWLLGFSFKIGGGLIH